MSIQIPQETWEAHRSAITDMYMNKKWTVKQISLTMEARGFTASSSQYVRQLKKWRLSKNATEEEWKYISKTLNRRALLGKTSVVLMHGRELSPTKIRKETRRHHRPSLMRRDLTPEAMENIIVRTPGLASDATNDLSSSQSISASKQENLSTSTTQDASLLPVADDLPSTVFMDLLDQTCKY